MEQIRSYFTSVDKLTSMYLAPGELPVLMLAGSYNTGKSTMVNNLLGRQVSPVDIIPATGVPITFSYGELFIITARLADGRSKVLNAGELASLTAGGISFYSRVRDVEINLGHPLLQKMRIVDTPGIDAPQGPQVPPEQLAAADHIAYMMHQRGPGEADRKYIIKLVETVGAGKISFWINCNLGGYDGSSLRESRRVLREICAREVRVYATDTMNPEAVRRFGLFIQDRAAETVVSRVTGRLKDLDRRIPVLTRGSLHKKGDAGFLLGFWEARRAAEQVVWGRNIIKTMVPVSQQIHALVEELIQPADNQPGVATARDKAGAVPDPAKVRGKIQSLLTRAAADPVLNCRHETVASLKDLAAALDREQFLVTAAGAFSTGKTTFFNALLGETLLPAENRPTTFAITRLCYGAEKRAAIKFAAQVAIPTHHVDNRYATICRHELSVLEHWLTDPSLLRQISALEKEQKGERVKVSPEELLQEIEALKETFARVKRRFKGGRRPWKSLFKRIPINKFTGTGRPDRFVVHFPRRENLELYLANKQDRLTLLEIAGSHRALRVDEIDIRYPAELLRTATFVDTPGLDSVYHRHREITTRYLPESDCFLLFLNGKHILTRPDLGTYGLISRTLKESQNAAGKLHVIVNFADTLSERERERVRNHLHANLVRPSRGLLKPGRIYFISALDALTGKDRQPFNKLIADLTKHIWSSRCAANYARITRQARKILKELPGERSFAPSLQYSDTPFRKEMEQLLDETAKTIAQWRERIDSLAGPADLRGFRDGKRSVKKGFWGLARKKVDCPSYRDLAGEVNAALARFNARWNPGTGAGVTGLNVTTIENALNRLLKSKQFNPTEARNALHGILDNEEARLRSAVQTMARKIDAVQKETPQANGAETPGNLTATAASYVRELETLEKEFYAPGGIADGKRQGTG